MRQKQYDSMTDSTVWQYNSMTDSMTEIKKNKSFCVMILRLNTFFHFPLVSYAIVTWIF